MSIGLFSFLDEEIKYINTNEKYLDDFKNVYIKKIGEEAVEKVISNAISVFSKCINKDKTLVNKTGIVLGKIQSGKTSNFLGLIAMGFDNNIDVVILIGGKDSKLLVQNDTRLKEVFNLNDSDKVVIENINFIYKNSNPNIYYQHLKSRKNHKLIITCLKNAIHLEKVYKFLKKSNLVSKNIMIIDDEGDQATLNANAEIKNKKATILYQKVTNILNILKHFVYIQVTATPYANLFLRDSDILKPQFVQLTYPSESYMGLNEFHGQNSNNFIRIIDNNEINKNENWNNNPIFSESFSKALSCFLIASCLKMIENQTINSKSTMLIHIYRTIINHSISAIALRNVIEDLKKKLKLEKTDLNYFQFLNFCNYGFFEYFNRPLDYNNNKSDKEIIDHLKIVFESLEVVEVNRTNPIRNREKLSYAKHVILVGADLVERGITISDLLVTYITRRSKGITNADTVLQRARWFGYRNKIKKYMRIFCLEEIQDDYEEILIMDEDLWFNLEDLSNNDALLSEYVKTLNLNKKNLRPTRQGVVKWNLEQIMLWHSQKEAKNNQEIELNLYDELLKKGQIEKYDSIEHKSINYPNISSFEVQFSNIWENVLEYCDISLDFWNYWKSNRNDTKVKVLIMNPNSNSKEKYNRTLLKNNKIQIFRGRSTKEITENYYKGDRYLNEYPQNKNLILVEIFKFDIYQKNKNNSEEKKDLQIKDAIFYAIYFPGEGVIRYVAKQD
ncbi:MAG: Z1 domain-containing protein [Spiroplasma sp.]|nr:Z1 domain-containing protein [Spiroplasma sp.]